MRDTSVTVGAVAINNVLRALSSVALTRLLPPEVFGIAGIIGSIAFIFAMISDLGFQAFVVRHPDGDKARFLDVIWTIRLIRAAVLTALLLVLARPIALAIGKGELTPVIAVSAWLFLIEGLSSLSLVTALRERLLMRLSLLETAIVVLQLLLSILLAMLWGNYWSILVAMLATSAVKSIASYLIFPNARRALAYDARYSRELWRFARFVTGSSVISMVLIQCDKVVLARVFPLDVLGYYMLATNLALAPASFTSAYASRVLYPHYARVWRETPERLAHEFYARRGRISLLFMLGAGGIIGAAGLIVGLFYDERYAQAALYLRLLAMSPLLGLTSMAANEVLTASGRIQVTFHANVAKIGWLAVAGPTAFYAFGPLGLIAVVGAIELPSLLRLRTEIALLLVGGVGIIGGFLVERLLLPLV
jgi:lipopolysaccharide exporter